ncbi:nuclear transport factor 2 family protein [Polaromonas sp.]|uniref:nuclear transport factor 2 family protein n=1 Tax=Polaromonas sp. TaxID=1869339 RepID=UPI002FC90311
MTAPLTALASRKPWAAALRWAILAASLSLSAAHADDYDHVNRLIKAGQMGEALARADQYLAGKPRDPQMRFMKGVILTETGKPAEAINLFTKITEDYPELPEPYNNLAVLYAGQNQYDKARAALEMAIRTNPSYATAHENLGDVYAKLASQAYSKALQLDSGNAGVQPKLALIRSLLTNPESKGQKPAAPAPTTTPAAPAVNKAPAAAVIAKAPVAPPPAPAPTAVVAKAPPTPAPVATPPAAAAPAPAAPVPAAAPATAPGANKEVEAAVRAWASAWAAKDMNGYLAAYGKDFDTPGNQSRKAWEEDRRARIVGKSHISVKLSGLVVAVNGAKATVKFKQDYSADALNISSRKTLELAKAGERWLIVRESTGG